MDYDISFDTAKLQTIVEAVNNFYSQTTTSCNEIGAQISTINSNWEGDQKALAKNDLDNLYNAITTISNNAQKAYSLLNEVNTNFGNVRY